MVVLVKVITSVRRAVRVVASSENAEACRRVGTAAAISMPVGISVMQVRFATIIV